VWIIPLTGNDASVGFVLGRATVCDAPFRRPGDEHSARITGERQPTTRRDDGLLTVARTGTPSRVAMLDILSGAVPLMSDVPHPEGCPRLEPTT
jgi:hypothetical protein